jgi:prefoldin alpha subunit
MGNEKEDKKDFGPEDLINLRAQVEREIQYLSSSFSQLKGVCDRFNDNLAILESFCDSKPDTPIIVPLTSSMFVSAKLKSNDKFLIDIGTGYFVEKSTKETEEYYQRKIRYICEQMEKVDNGIEIKKHQFQTLNVQLSQQTKAGEN